MTLRKCPDPLASMVLTEASEAYNVLSSKNKELNDEIAALFKLPNSPEKDKMIEVIGCRIQELNDAMTKSISLLPSYDIRLLKDQLKTLHVSYLSLKKNARSKLDFGFKLDVDVKHNQGESEMTSCIEMGMLCFIFIM